MSSDDNSVQVTFDIPGSNVQWRMISFAGEEGISSLFRFELQLAAASSTLKLGDLVGQPGLISVTTNEGVRYFSGLVSELTQQDSGRKFTVYKATLVPAAWRLTLRSDCRIFQKMTARQIVEEVLGPSKLDYSFRCRGNQEPPLRDYCVQYRESDWSFVCRLLEEEGYHFYFRHSSRGHQLSITNDSMASPDIPGEPELMYVGPDSPMPGEEHIFRLHLGEGIHSGCVSLTDYNFESPALDLKVTHKASRDDDLEVYDYPGIHLDQGRGKTLSQVQLEAFRAQAVLLDGKSSCPRLVSGLSFKLDGHVRDDLNREQYLVTNVQHRAEKSAEDLEAGALDSRCTYDNSFQAIPRKLPYRALRMTRKPMVQGVQTAVVVGPSTEEIYTDKHGRVKVHFHWDRLGKRDQDSSCWVRVSQLWAGQGWGAMYIPRIGQEVIVDFLEGDPDRPLITGRVYHAQNPPPYDLPGQKTKSTIISASTPGSVGSNEIRFEDMKGSEEIYTHAEKDQNEVVEHDMTTRVLHDQSLYVANDRDKTIGRDETTTVDRDRTESVGRHETIDVAGNRTEEVIGSESVTVVKNRVHMVAGSQKVTVKKDATLAVVKNETEKVGLRKKLTIGAAYTIMVGARMAVTVGADLAHKVVGTMTEKVGTTKTMRVGTKLEIICGKARLVMEKGGRVTLEGSEFLFRASGPVKIKGKAMQLQGSSLNVKTSGAIKLKGSKISEN